MRVSYFFGVRMDTMPKIYIVGHIPFLLTIWEGLCTWQAYGMTGCLIQHINTLANILLLILKKLAYFSFLDLVYFLTLNVRSLQCPIKGITPLNAGIYIASWNWGSLHS
jgi:hypothetical protein